MARAHDDPGGGEGGTSSVDSLSGCLGLTEQELRQALEQELERAAVIERELTPHAFAHTISRVLTQDHLRTAEQLEGAVLRLRADGESEERR